MADLSPGRMVATRLSEMLHQLLSGQVAARALPGQLRELANWIEGQAGEQKQAKGPKRATAVREIYEYWLKATERSAARHKLTAERRTKIEARLRSFSVADVKKAIDYVAQSPFHRGENDRNQRYDDITTICVNDTRMEGYRNMLDVDETPGAHRTGEAGNLVSFSEAARLRGEAAKALQKGDLDAYDQSQRELRRLRDDAGRNEGGAAEPEAVPEAEGAS
jgi:hypothetical protein